MPRASRDDTPGAWHHVMNRGLARRTVFERRADMRMFLAELARAVRSERIEVHAFAVLSTHFHLLVRSPRGELGEAMRRVQNAYVRWFNRSRMRDGPLFRGRYCSRRVTNDEYRLAVVRYIDMNPVQAQLALQPERYPYCSAGAYQKRKGPPWLERGWIEAEVRRASGRVEFCYEDYASRFHSGGLAATPAWVERRLLLAGDPDDELDSLLGATPSRVIQWMQRKAALGDGTRAGLARCAPEAVRSVVDEAQERNGAWQLCGHGPPVDGWRNAQVVLLRLLTGASLREIAPRCGISKSGVQATLDQHRGRMASDLEYCSRMADLVQQTVDRGSPGASPTAGARRAGRATVD